jgi:glycosyltransferase involved in cell wall biosynthesis
MAKVSVIIPARNEIYLQKTIDDLLAKATGDVEVIVILDGYWPDPIIKEDQRVILIHREKRGMRASINAGMAVSTGQYLMKIDAHCIIAPGYDVALQSDFEDDWVVTPRRYSLEMDVWDIRYSRPLVDYEYLGYPFHKRLMHKSKTGIHAWVWDARIEERADQLIDENMTFQGSCWFVNKKEFQKRIGKLDEQGYGTFIGEAQEIGLKYWLGGGKCMINKKTWYSHLWKGTPYREAYKAAFGVPYTRMSFTELKEGNKFTVDYWMNNRWEGRIHDLEWLIDRFAPVPSWEEYKWEGIHGTN